MIDFHILGPLEVACNGQVIGVGGPRQQIVLGMLLLEPNRVIALDRLVSAVWDENPPSTARSQIQICISGLRRQFEIADRQRDRVVSIRPGYMLALASDSLDSRLFESRIGLARSAQSAGELLNARREFRDALALWRGPALDGLESRLIQQGVAQLDERRLLVLEECLTCESQLGAYQESIGELVRLVQDYPLRESFHALLMVALYGAGRQAEALGAYRRARETLVEELAIEPGAELQQLHLSILGGADVRQLIRPRTPILPIEVGRLGAAPTVQIPRMLVADIPDFTGRKNLVDRIVNDITLAASTENAEQAVLVNTIVGRGGVGKTTLAIHAAHKVANYFPDGQLFARLRTNDRPTDPAEILERFLRAIGVSSSVLPEGIEERAEIYRDHLARRRMLVILDDAMSEQQVSILLPGSALCSVIVTSRKRLTGFAAANRIDLGDFSHDSAVELLKRIVGADRIDAERDAVATLCGLCGYLPLALRIVAARLAARPHWRVADLVERLVDESHRLDELNHGSMGMRASISLTYDSLSSNAQRLFRRLALFNTAGFSHWIGIPLLEENVATAQEYLEELTEAYLIDAEPSVLGPTRYRFHDIMRPFAYERLILEETPLSRHEALARLFGAFLWLSRQAHRREYSGDFLLVDSAARQWPLPESLANRLLKAPLDWFEHERMSIMAAVRQAATSGMTELSWDLAQTAVTLFESHSHLTDWRESHETALKAACRLGDRRGEATMRYSLGSLYMFRQQPEQAASEFASALKLFEEQAESYGAALVLRNLAFLDRMGGNLARALSRWGQALTTFRSCGDLIAEAHILHNMAQVKLDVGDESDARDLLARAKTICSELGNRRVGAQVDHRLGELYLRCGELQAAASAFEDVLTAVRESGDQVGECYALLGLGIVRTRERAVTTAAQLLTAAEDIASIIGERMLQGRVVLARADLALRQADTGRAAAYADWAIRDFEDIKATVFKAEALIVRGQVHLAANEPRAALEVWDKTLAGLSAPGLPSPHRLVQEVRDRIASLANTSSADASTGAEARDAIGQRPN
jgi:DNA-binding SARP family transcriptional activator